MSLIIHMTGKIKREFIYTPDLQNKGRLEAAIFLYRPSVKGKCAIIPLSCAYKYDDPETLSEKMDVLKACMKIAEALNFPINGTSAARIQAAIQDGIPELFKMPPPSAAQRATHEGEATLSINGEKKTFAVKI